MWPASEMTYIVSSGALNSTQSVKTMVMFTCILTLPHTALPLATFHCHRSDNFIVQLLYTLPFSLARISSQVEWMSALKTLAMHISLLLLLLFKIFIESCPRAAFDMSFK